MTRSSRSRLKKIAKRPSMKISTLRRTRRTSPSVQVPRELDRCFVSFRTSSGNSEKESSPSLGLSDSFLGPGRSRIRQTRFTAEATSSTSVSELPKRRTTCYETVRGQPSHRPRLEITAPLAVFVQGFAMFLAAAFVYVVVFAQVLLRSGRFSISTWQTSRRPR